MHRPSISGVLSALLWISRGIFLAAVFLVAVASAIACLVPEPPGGPSPACTAGSCGCRCAPNP